MIEVGENARIHINWKVSPYDYSKEKEKSIIAKASKKYSIPKDHIRVIPDFLTIDKDGKVTLNKADGVTMTERELIRNRLIAEVKITNERCKELMAGADFSIIPEEFRKHVRAVYGE